MSTSKIEIYNKALDLGGGRANISTDTETSKEATLCNRWYPSVRDNVLKAAPWPCTKAWSRLAVLAERDANTEWTGTSPAPGWRFAYARPADLLAPRYLHTYARFEQARYANSMAIMANEPEAVLAYTARCDDVSLWDVDLEHAVTLMLAAHITYSLQGKEGRWDRLHGMAVEVVGIARAAAANAEDIPQDTIPDWISARGYSGNVREARYFYPYENLNMVTV